jgi:D-cysteine desulfhydrase
MTQTALERRYPAAETIPRVELADLPTPVDRLERLGDEIDVPNLWVKRDDRTGELYGGNKVRKLEYLLGEAQAQGHQQVWTVGAIGSHHVLATSIYARQQGLKPAALHFPQPVTDHVLENLRALSTTQPELTLAGHRAQIPVEVLRTKVREWLARGPEVYYIPAGGSSPTGVLGYVNAACELADQIEAGEVDEPDVIFCAAGTCGTLAGLLVGTTLADLSCEIVGVRVVDRLIANRPAIIRLANKTLDKLGEARVPVPDRPDRDRLTLLNDYFGPDYGVPTDQGEAAIERAAELEDLELEPTYTGKTMAGLIGERERFELADKSVLYWHTLSSVDLSDRIATADVAADLPEEYQTFFER